MVYATFFHRQAADIDAALASGLSARLSHAVREELRRVGRDVKAVEFEFDSHENVEKNFEGDYFLRFR